MAAITLLFALSYSPLQPASRPAVGAARTYPPPSMLGIADVAFLGCGLALATSTGLLFKRIAGQRSIDSGIGGVFDFTRGDNEPEIYKKIREARSTRAPGFVLEVVEAETEEADDVDDTAAEQPTLAATAEADAQARREELQTKLDEAVDREDYAAAASLKQELDELIGR